MKTIRDYMADVGPDAVRSMGLVRRMAISLTTKVLWQLVGFRLPGGDSETLPADPFTGIGHYARPPAGSKPEAIAVMVGDAKTPVIVAVRDEQTRAAVAGGLTEDETAVFNSQAIIYIKADGTIEARTADGTAVSLATKHDLQILRAALASAVISLGAGGAATVNVEADATVALMVPPVVPPTWPVGTTKLKGE